jgi:flagellar biosynthesis/type III secretory pathway protein FliH
VGSPPELVAEAVKMDEAIQTADERMALLSGDKEMRRAYWRYQMILSDYTSEMNYARDEGLEEGLKKGLKKGREEGLEEGRQRFFELLDQGLSAEDIKQRLSGSEQCKRP